MNLIFLVKESGKSRNAKKTCAKMDMPVTILLSTIDYK